MSRDRILLGAAKDYELVFGKFGVTERNGFSQFAASFFTVRPFRAKDFDMKKYWEDYIEDMETCNNDKWVLYELKNRDCEYSELAEELAADCEDARDCLDCSLYPEEVIVKNPDTNTEEPFYFLSCSSGQCDTREDMEEIINPEAYNLLHKLWDKYHLSKVDDSVINQVKELMNTLSMTDEEEENWIKEYIVKHFDDIEEL